MFFTFLEFTFHCHLQVVGGDPLLKLIAVDWFTVNKSVDRIALHPRCLVQVTLKFSRFYIFNTQIYHCKLYLGKDARFALDILINDFAKPSINPKG